MDHKCSETSSLHPQLSIWTKAAHRLLKLTNYSPQLPLSQMLKMDIKDHVCYMCQKFEEKVDISITQTPPTNQKEKKKNKENIEKGMAARKWLGQYR